MIHVSRVMNASRIKVWESLIDTRLWPVWGPSVIQVESARRYIDVGLRGRVKTAARIWMNFEITEFKPLHYWRWRVAGIPATGHRLHYLDQNRCLLVFELPLLAFPYALICQMALRRIDRLVSEESHNRQTSVRDKEINPESCGLEPSALRRSEPNRRVGEVGQCKRSVH